MPKLRIVRPNGRNSFVLLERRNRQKNLDEILRTCQADIETILPFNVADQLASTRLTIATSDIERFLGILKTGLLKRELPTYRFEVER